MRWKTVLSLLLLSSACAPERPACLPLEIGDERGNYFIPGSWGEIPYKVVDGNTLLLDAYVQPGDESRPGVIVVHGGSWNTGNRITYVAQLLETLTLAGFNWFSVDFRQGSEYGPETSLEDLESALGFIRCHAAEFQTDPERLALLGEDSGAHLAALLSQRGSSPVQALVTLGGIFDLTALEKPDEVLPGYLLNQDLDALSPALKVAPDPPPTLAIHGRADSEVPPAQSDRFCTALKAAGARCETLFVTGASHRPENWHPSQWSYKRRMVQWLWRELKFKPPEYQAGTTPGLSKDLVYAEAGVEGREHPLRLDAFVPDGEGPFAAVVLVHGGGWEAGDKVTYITPLFRPLAKAGFAWFSIDYRLTPKVEHPAQLDDLRRAIRFVRHQAADFRIDPGRIAILGESAGGQMVMQVAAQPCPGDPGAADPVERQPCHPQAVVPFYGVYDFEDLQERALRSLSERLFGLEPSHPDALGMLREFSPIEHVHSGIPPVLLIHGTGELLWEQGQEMASILEEAGVDVEWLALEDAPHGMENWEGHERWQHYKERLVEWLGEKLK